MRLAARANKGDWLVLVGPPGKSHDIAARLADEVHSLASGSTETSKDPADATSLGEAIVRAPRNRTLLVSGLDSLSNDAWAYLDLLRNRLMRVGPIVLIMSEDSATRMAEAAPNIASWIGGAVWEVDLQGEHLSTEERSARLADLRAWARTTDEEVIRRAERGELPREPEFVEWLLLLGRSDLLASP